MRLEIIFHCPRLCMFHIFVIRNVAQKHGLCSVHGGIIMTEFEQRWPYKFCEQISRCFNSIMRLLGYIRNEITASWPVAKSYCLPSFVYGFDVWQLRKEDARSANNGFRKIFIACMSESVKPLLFYCSCLHATDSNCQSASTSVLEKVFLVRYKDYNDVC